MRRPTAAFVAVAVLAIGGPALAHHSGAMFDHAKTTTLTGAVKEWRWSNPHGWILLVAPGPGGKATEWAIECSSINILARKGWSAKTFKPGDKITVTMHPMKDGVPSGLVTNVTLPDGQSLTDHDY